MKARKVSAPSYILWNIWVSRPGTEAKVVGTFVPRIDYPGGIEAYALMVWASVDGNTSRDEARWIDRHQRVIL